MINIVESDKADYGHTGPLDCHYFHPDHLGSSSYITNLDGVVSQHMQYLPFGETMVDEHLNSRNSPFKYNGKEFDEETGNYYYGARYYNPKWSIWVSVDPLAEKYPEYSPYNYCANNPIKYIDPNGNDYILAVLARDSKTDRVSKLEVRATVYITGPNASPSRAKELNLHAKSVYKTKQIDGAEVSFNINYVYKEKISQKLKPGENVLNFSDKADRSHVKGRQKRLEIGKFIFFTGNRGEIYLNGIIKQ